MSNKNRIGFIVDQVKNQATGLNEKEKEMLRDELLSMLLFNDFKKSTNGINYFSKTFKGLSEEEKALIKKLSDQTDALYNAMRDDSEED